MERRDVGSNLINASSAATIYQPARPFQLLGPLYGCSISVHKVEIYALSILRELFVQENTSRSLADPIAEFEKDLDTAGIDDMYI